MDERVDLRSDTVTTPTPEMREAMFRAEVGDDGRGEDPTVQRLEQEAAARMGHAAGVFTISGTMGNLTALMTHLRPGEEALLEAHAHILTYEAGGIAAVAGAQPRALPGERGRIPLEMIAEAIEPGSSHRPRTALLCLENTHNLAGGTVLDPDYTKAACRLAHERGLSVHLDGERIFNAAVALGAPVTSLTADCDSVMFGLSKGLGAPLGSVLTGSVSFIREARRRRQRLGGGMRQAGIIAAAGLVALDTMIERLAEDHANARRLGEGIAALDPRLTDLSRVQTNIVLLDTGPLGLEAKEACGRLERAGLRTLPVGARTVRLVTHKDVQAAHIERALAILRQTLGPLL